MSISDENRVLAPRTSVRGFAAATILESKLDLCK